MQLYDTSKGKLVRNQVTPKTIQDKALAISPGGKLLAFALDKTVEILDAETGAPLGTREIPVAFCSGLAFSPDGTELAAVLNHNSTIQLIAWDLEKGEVVANHVIPGGPNFPAPGWTSIAEINLEWLSDGSAWLIAGHALINRKDGRWVWSTFAPPYADPKTGRMPFGTDVFVFSQSIHLLDTDHALAGLGGRGIAHHLEVVTLPWPKIDASLKAMESDAPALLKPGGSLTLKFHMGTVRHSTPQEAQAELTKALTAAIDSMGFKVADGQPVVLHVRHNEEPGMEYRAMGFRGRSQPGVVSTKFVDDFALTIGDATVSVWADQKVRSGLGFIVSGYRIGNEINEVSLRKAGFEALKSDFLSLGMPYFIPQDKDKALSMLPGLTVLTSSPSARISSGTAKAKATTRGQRKP